MNVRGLREKSREKCERILMGEVNGKEEVL